MVVVDSNGIGLEEGYRDYNSLPSSFVYEGLGNDSFASMQSFAMPSTVDPTIIENQNVGVTGLDNTPAVLPPSYDGNILGYSHMNEELYWARTNVPFQPIEEDNSRTANNILLYENCERSVRYPAIAICRVLTAL